MRLIQRVAYAAAFMLCATCTQQPIATNDHVSDALAAVAQTTAPAASQPQGTLEQRLDRLCEQLEKQRQDLHIPGFAIAIVKDDKIILSRGFGVRDVEKNIPVTPETIFAIGSSSKAFTAALAAMMVDEGTMAWDDPVRRHLPQFHLFDKEADEQITIRDLLCHRSGLERTDLVWASGQASREEILQCIATAEPTAKFREKFQYQNVMYLAAGMAAANAAGIPESKGGWDTLLANRIFKPLGMKRSNTDIEKAKKDKNISLGYSWDEEKEQFKHLPMRNLNPIAPAGAINSSVIDMSQWLRLQLNKGEVNGKRLISPERFDEMRTSHISIAEGAGMDYGLGWMLHDWQGKKVVEHGGNIDGFGAQVTLVPETNLGYVLLTNVTATPLQGMSINLVCEALLGEWKETVETPLDPTSVADYLGKYHLHVMDKVVTVQMKDGKLAVDVPGQMLFTLKPPDAEGKWVFEVTDTIAVSFAKDDSGRVIALNFHQSGLILDSPKEGVTQPVEIGLDEAQKYLGRYRDDTLKIDVTVVHRNGRLAIDVPQQMVFDLRLPNDEGKWVFRATDTIAVRFEQDSTGAVTGMTHFQNGQEHLLPRIADTAPENVPTVEEIMALHERGCGSDGIPAMGSIRLSARMRMVNQGINNIRMTAVINGIDRFAQTMDMGKFGWIKMGLDGETGWTDSVFEAGEEVPKSAARLMRLQNPLLAVVDWRGAFDKLEITRLETIDDRPVVVVSLSAPESVQCTAFVDRETGRPIKIVYDVPAPPVGNIETTETLSDWREVDGVMIPYRWEIANDLLGKTIVEVEKIETRIDVLADAFKMPKRK